MSDQCNICGSFKDIEHCLFCLTPICQNCAVRHSPFCEDLQKLKKRGEGPTIANVPVPPHRPGQEVPPTTEPDRRVGKSAVLGAPYSFNVPLLPVAPGGLAEYAKSIESVEPEEDSGNQGNEAFVDILAATTQDGSASIPKPEVDQALDAVKDLLGE